MSRGPGRVERAILEEIAATGEAWVTRHDTTPAEQESRRRAIRSLESKGLVAVRRVRVAAGSFLSATSPERARAEMEAELRGLEARAADLRARIAALDATIRK